MTVRGPANGFPAGFYNVTGTKWCRHKEQFVTTTTISSLSIQMACSNCGSVAIGRDRQAARDALMKLEAVGTVSEIAP